MEHPCIRQGCLPRGANMPAYNEASGGKRELARMKEALGFLHRARPAQALQPAEIEWIARRLRRRSPRPLFRWPAVAALALGLLVGATIAAAKGDLRSWPLIGELFGPASAPHGGSARVGKPRRPTALKPAAEVSSVTPSSGVVAPLAVPVQPPLAARATARDPEQPPTPAPVLTKISRTPDPVVRPVHRVHEPVGLAATTEEETGSIVAESRSFASVIQHLYRTHDARATLDLLDAHERRYPNGTMLLESQLLRAELYLKQSREREALAVLDALALPRIPRGRELQTIRGELRIKLGRCSDGKKDLDGVLAKGGVDVLAKRALQALSRCPDDEGSR